MAGSESILCRATPPGNVTTGVLDTDFGKKGHLLFTPCSALSVSVSIEPRIDCVKAPIKTAVFITS